MDSSRLGTICRALRIKKSWRQADLAAKAHAPRSAVSRLELGKVVELRVDVVLRIVEALGGRMDFIVRWQGGELDRLINARHSALHESVARSLLALPGWVLAPEVSFSIYGERGLIDILAWHAQTRTLLVIELKTEMVDVNEMMGTADRKRRLAAKVARDRGWHANTVALWIILAGSRTNRRRMTAHSTTLRAAFPLDGRSMRSWLLHPAGPVACLFLWPNARGPGTKPHFATVKRVRGAATGTPRA